jgi:hypothetical protein
MQGRIDLPKYRMAMNVCLNGIPVEEGAWTRRPGSVILGPTRGGLPARVIGYEYQEGYPTLLEFTDDILRVWYANEQSPGWSVTGQGLVPDSSVVVTSISTATPAVITVASAQSWLTNEYIYFNVSSASALGGSYSLSNRQFAITQLTPTTFAIADGITDAAVNGAAVNWQVGDVITANHILQIPTTWGSGSWANIRFVSLGQQSNGLQGILLNGAQKPAIITVTPNSGVPGFALTTAAFSDGPYNNIINGAVATPQSGSETPSYIISPGNGGWSSVARYNTGDMTGYAGTAYMSTTGGTGGTNVGNNPSTSGAWVAVTGSGAPGSYPEWVSGGSYTPWNGGSPPGSIVTFNGGTYVASNHGTHSFSNTQSPADQSLSRSWEPVAIISTEELSGNVGFSLLFTPWANTTNYGAGDVASFAGIAYQSLQANNLNNEPDTTPTYWVVVPSEGLPFGPFGAQPTDVGRSIRLFQQPPLWSASISYSSGQLVTFNSAYYQAISSNTGAQPDVNLSQWQPSATGGVWTWGLVTEVTNANTIVAQILGPALLFNLTPITVYQVGAFSETTGWPTCGLFYQGRLWLAGAAPNRIDGSTSDDPYNFSPTLPDGTVADNNAISLTFNSVDNEIIQWLAGNQQGILVGTLSREWLINASTTADVITPASVEISPVTHYGSAFIEPRLMGLATVFVQRYTRKIMEMVANVFSGKYNAPNLALTAKHLTGSGIAELAYQEELAPLIWARCNDGSLISCTYRRVTAFQTDNPALLNEPSTFAGWARHALGSGRTVISITKTPTPGGASDQLAMVTNGIGFHAVELMTNLFDVEDTIYDAFFVDTAIVPTAAKTVAYGAIPVTYTRFYGLTYATGTTVSVWAGGLDCGDFVVQAGGFVDVPYGSAGGLYSASYLAGLVAAGYDGVTNMVMLDGSLPIPVAVGNTYTSQGQIVRPAIGQEAGAQNGPAQGKNRRVQMITSLLQNTQGISFGTSFSTVLPANLGAFPSAQPLAQNQLFSGVYWTPINDPYTFDGMPCWQITRPYPATVVNIGGFLHTEDR